MNLAELFLIPYANAYEIRLCVYANTRAYVRTCVYIYVCMYEFM